MWDKFKWIIAGESLSLNNIEHDILRKKFTPLDARIHFAVNCASVGCPILLNKAFSAPELNQTLEQLASDFVNSGRDVKFYRSKKKLETSKILSWFKGDFKKDPKYGTVLKFIQRYIDPARTGISSSEVSGYKVDDFGYDWDLNISKSEK